MTQHRGTPAAAPTRGGWTRDVVELALLCAAAGTAHLLATGAPTTASVLLLAFGALLAAGAAVRCARVRRPAPAAEVVAEPDLGELAEPRALWRLRASVTDDPGRLAGIAAGLAGLGGDIRTVHVHPVAGGAVDEVLVHVPTSARETDLVRAVVDAGGREVTARPADVRELDDVPTRTLHLAADLVRGRGDLVRALRGTLGPVEVRWQEDATGPDGADGRWLRLTAPGGGALVLERAGAAFTPAEFARARAMVDLAATCRERLRPDVRELVTTGGEALTLRAADRADLELVAEFHARCSAATRYRRYSSPGPAGGERGLLRLLTPALGRSLLVLDADGQVVAMGNLMRDGTTAELALLVRDDRQRGGIGTRLAAELVAQAEADGTTAVWAHTRVDDTAIARTLRAAGLKLVGVPEPGEWSWSRTLRPAAGRTAAA
ncbi:MULTISPECIES: GNAT family N-acetyltransferase [unclassified Saccharopolyspora]|uniref:GNAT family N-acetyltransferase n=1 Tax=unclassified Saccharopolyspora TaxID=2646250 RepID=UPI001CD505FA|nr:MULTISPECIES: GNAT family N-acetyltransferase [unclassified Saccharopolyspora]MCA1193418.1 GNAT family N-acetyltransferase [Saccharopolyspora sp. 6V]MCA1280651.1 GNAT family N-acetyltransferase [Saccharopolyspora sp. 7B]